MTMRRRTFLAIAGATALAPRTAAQTRDTPMYGLIGKMTAAKGEREELAYRLWQLKREALRARYRRVGVPVVEWREGEPLEGALAEVGAFRRQARFSRA